MKSNGAYASENSLKLKLKMNSAGQLVNANTLPSNPTNDMAQQSGMLTDKFKKSKTKEVLVFDQQNITEIKLDNEVDSKSSITTPTTCDANELKPLKLKLKLNSDNNNVSLYSVSKVEHIPSTEVASTVVTKTADKIDSEYESDGNEKTTEDDELINELKNSYQDDDYSKRYICFFFSTYYILRIIFYINF